MTRFFDWLVEVWDRLRGILGFHRLTKKGRGDELVGRGFFRRSLYFLRPVLMLLILIYVGTMVWRFSWVRGETLGYPQVVLAEAGPVSAEGAQACTASELVKMEQSLLDMIVNQNDWAPATPQYKMGFFGLVAWEDTPFFDNKASFQRGVLAALRRVSIELADQLGRLRGTSAADADLEAARSSLQIDEQQWIFNPFDSQRPLLATSAASSYRNAMDLLGNFNQRLVNCDATFDARADNLIQLLDRIANDLGSVTDQMASRSQGRIYDVSQHQFVDGQGNDRGWFDFQADNMFHDARGRMYAYHGLLQAIRVDFKDAIAQKGAGTLWDRMEARVAEASDLSPLIVSNGREDGFAMPNHLSVMAQSILRARANMTELRDVLAR
ncbi:MAG: DUF2333 family protein [Pseudomonadota bacterium]